MNLSQQEKEILIELRKGNEQAFEKIYRIYRPRLFGKLMKIVKSKPYAEEILQAVFVKLWEHRKAIDPEKSFRSFLFKIAENNVYDFFRKAARDKHMASQLIALSVTDNESINTANSDDEQLEILNRAIEALPPQRKQVFRLCKLEGKSYKEVSDLLRISVSTISDHIVKATKTIREYFEKNNIPPRGWW